MQNGQDRVGPAAYLNLSDVAVPPADVGKTR